MSEPEVKAPAFERVWLTDADASWRTSQTHESMVPYVPESRLNEVRQKVWEAAIATAYQVYRSLDKNEAEFLEGKFTQGLTESERTALVSFHDQQYGAKYVVTALEAARSKSNEGGKEVSDVVGRAK